MLNTHTDPTPCPRQNILVARINHDAVAHNAFLALGDDDDEAPSASFLQPRDIAQYQAFIARVKGDSAADADAAAEAEAEEPEERA